MPETEIVPNDDKVELSKRFYIPFTVKTSCPKCKEKLEKDLTKDYLSYPVLGELTPLHFFCHNCNEDFIVTVELNMTLTLGPTQ